MAARRTISSMGCITRCVPPPIWDTCTSTRSTRPSGSTDAPWRSQSADRIGRAFSHQRPRPRGCSCDDSNARWCPETAPAASILAGRGARSGRGRGPRRQKRRGRRGASAPRRNRATGRQAGRAPQHPVDAHADHRGDALDILARRWRREVEARLRAVPIDGENAVYPDVMHMTMSVETSTETLLEA
jgi:hypothetical protein